MTSLVIDVVLFSCMFVLVTGIVITAAHLLFEAGRGASRGPPPLSTQPDRAKTGCSCVLRPA
jgi:hypothetical protein